MSKQDETVQLPERIESLLQKWPEPVREDEAWEKSAEAISARLGAAKEEAQAHAALLEPPLPRRDDDGSLEADADSAEKASADEEPEEAPRSLLEIARMSLQSSEAPSDNADIARESLSLATQARASAPAIAEATRARAAEMAVAMTAPPQRDSTVPAASAQPAPVASLAVAREQKAKRSLAGPAAMLVLAALGVAAAALIVVKAQQEPSPAVALAPAGTATAAAASAAPMAADKPKQDPEVVALEDLATGEGAASAPAKLGAAKGGEVIGKTAAPGAGEPQASPPSAPEAVAKAEPKPAKEEPEAKMKPAATAGDLPDKPSTGAVQAAIGSVMGGARACVAGQDAPSRATVTFGSDGRVQAVAVSGPAAGTPAEACIRAALSKARVQPFARASFSVGSTVRP